MELKWKYIYHLEIRTSQKTGIEFATFSIGVDKGFINSICFGEEMLKLKNIFQDIVKDDKGRIINYQFHVAGDIEIEDHVNFKVWGINVIKSKPEKWEHLVPNYNNQGQYNQPRDNSGNARMNNNDMNQYQNNN